MKRLEEQAIKNEEAFENRLAQLETLIKGNGVALQNPGISGLKLQDVLIYPISDKGSSHVPERGPDTYVRKSDAMKSPEDCFEIIPPTNVMGSECDLAFENIKNIVVYGTIIEGDGLNEIIHGVPLSVGSVRVSVAGEVKPDSPLPIPVKGKLETVREAIRSHVA